VWLRRMYRCIFPSFRHEIRELLEDSTTVLDVGCGKFSVLRNFDNIFSVGIDKFQPYIDKSRKQGIHDKYYNADVMDIGKMFGESSFDCVMLLDLIEHLKKKDALKLIKVSEKIAKKKVIIFTPNGWMDQDEYDGNPYQKHKSAWHPDELERLGYSVKGFHGWKVLRGKRGRIKLRPLPLWTIFSDITQLFLKGFPRLTSSLLCVKKKNKNI